MTIKEHPDLNKERVELFLAAMESGEYTQCTGQQRVFNRLEDGTLASYYCALGVATKVALDNGLLEELKNTFPSSIFSGDLENLVFRGGDLSGYVAHWYGFGSFDPNLIDSGEDGRTVAGLNDAGYSFWDLAQMGRKRWLKDQG